MLDFPTRVFISPTITHVGKSHKTIPTRNSAMDIKALLLTALAVVIGVKVANRLPF